MALPFKLARRKFLKTGTASLAGAVSEGSVKPAFAAPEKQPGDTKIVCVMGDYWHPAIAQETHVRRIFSSNKSYKVYFVLASRYLTPELLSDADLFISARYGGSDSLGWTPDPVVVERPRPDRIWTDEQCDAIIDNVTNRGMGWIAAHCTLANGREKMQKFMGMIPLLHQEVQPLGIDDLNQDHPITKGIPPFFINLDEQFAIELTEPETTTVLFKSTALHDKRVTVAGWALERGKGRVVGLLPGHYQWNYRVPEYQDIFWRAAHYAMQRDIPKFPDAKNY
jgi:type 1 glutamine amidotransferase